MDRHYARFLVDEVHVSFQDYAEVENMAARIAAIVRQLPRDTREAIERLLSEVEHNG